MTVEVIGDVLHFDGYVVGRLKSDVPATVRGRLEEALSNAYVDTDDDKKEVGEDACKAGYERGLDDMAKQAEEASEAGFVELKQIQDLAKTLKEQFEP